MSNQCSNLFNYRSFNLFPPFHTPLKPFSTTLRPVFPFHGNLKLIGRRSGNATALQPPIAAQSSSDVVLVATTEHHDGSLIFQFGDASEVVKNEVVEEIESKAELESNVVKVLDGDLERQVVVKKIEGEDDSYSGSLTEVADHADSIERLLDRSEEEVLSSQSDAKMYKSLEDIESTIDITESIAQLDGDESLNPIITFSVNSPNTDKTAEPQGTLSKDGDDESDDQLVSLKLESMQDPDIEVMGVKQPYGKDELHNMESEDASESNTENLMPPATIHNSEVELTDPANEDVNEELQDMNISEVTLIDEMPPSDPLGSEPLDELSQVQTVDAKVEATMEVSSTEAMDVKDLAMENELQEASMNKSDENDVAYEMPISCVEEAGPIPEENVSQSQSNHVPLKPTMQVIDIELPDTMAQNPDDVILQINDETEDTLVSVKVETMQVELIDITQTDELQKVEPEDTTMSDTKGFLPPTILSISNAEFVDAANEDMEEGLLDMNINEDTFIDEIPPSDPSGAEPTLDETTMEVSTTKGMDVKDQLVEDELQQVNYVMPIICIEDAEPLLEEEVSQPQSTPLELKPSMQVSDVELQDTIALNSDDGILQVIDENEDPLESVKLETMQVSEIELQDTVGLNSDDRILQVIDEIEDPSESVKLETMQVSEVESQDTIGLNLDDGILRVIDESEDPLESVKLETMQVSEIELQDTIGLNSDDGILRVIDESENPSESVKLETMQVSEVEQYTVGLNSDDEILQVIDEIEDPSESFKLEAMQASELEVMDEVETIDTRESNAEDSVCSETIRTSDVELTEAANVDMNIDEGILIYGLPPSDTLGAEPTSNEVSQLQSANVKLGVTMEVLTTEDMDVKDLAVEDELQQVSIGKSDKNDVAFVMPEEPVLEEEENQPCSTPAAIQHTIQVSDIEVQDTEGQSLNDAILQIIEEDAGDSYIKDVERSLHQLEAQLVQDEEVNHNMLEQCAEIDALGSSNLLDGSQLEAEIIEGKVSSSELAEASEETAMLFATRTEVEREETYLTDYILSSGTALLEHPFKELTGGDDAYFVASSKWLGVANGVSRWSFEGTDPGVYAQELMRTCEEIALNTTSVPMTNPVDLLCRGVKDTNISGSSNILIANFDGQALRVANIGDTGFIIIRHGAVYKKSSPLLHEFHFALQLEDCDDPLQLVEEYTIELEEGDMVVSATDGLFDNLYEQEIAMVVSKSLQAGMKPEEVAKVLATRAQEVGRSAFVRSPFSDAAQAAGYTGYSGGKPDNVAVIVSLVEKRSTS